MNNYHTAIRAALEKFTAPKNVDGGKGTYYDFAFIEAMAAIDQAVLEFVVGEDGPIYFIQDYYDEGAEANNLRAAQRQVIEDA